ncbi:hypothetical protein [Psychrobacillus sp. FSL K6-1464]|uniref:hypothetical protein n=1 Tax=Psychrobacillus sp. FSL K6-1464 TaxID=2921545 RepID=UPI0030FBA44A
MEIDLKTIEALQETMRMIVKSITDAFKNFIKWAQEHWTFIKENWSKFYQFEEEKPMRKKTPYYKKLSVQKMQHQVIDRKPRSMVRKIIN